MLKIKAELLGGLNRIVSWEWVKAAPSGTVPALTAYLEITNLPVSFAIFAENYHHFELNGGAVVQSSGTTLDGRALDSGDLDPNAPALAIHRANKTILMGIL